MEVLILIVFGILCAMIADHKGRSAVAWFLLGFFLHLIGLVLILVLSNLKEIESQSEELRRENRRLRERVRKDRQVADLRHQEAAARLTAHDRALGVDTSTRLRSGDPAVLAPPPVPGMDVQNTTWYFVSSRGREGPMDLGRLRQHFDAGELQPETLVWCPEQEDWLPLRDRADLQEALIA